jgi:hypothetical protein
VGYVRGCIVMWDPRGRELVFDKCDVVPGAVLRTMGGTLRVQVPLVAPDSSRPPREFRLQGVQFCVQRMSNSEAGVWEPCALIEAPTMLVCSGCSDGVELRVKDPGSVGAPSCYAFTGSAFKLGRAEPCGGLADFRDLCKVCLPMAAMGPEVKCKTVSLCTVMAPAGIDPGVGYRVRVRVVGRVPCVRETVLSVMHHTLVWRTGDSEKGGFEARVKFESCAEGETSHLIGAIIHASKGITHEDLGGVVGGVRVPEGTGGVTGMTGMSGMTAQVRVIPDSTASVDPTVWRSALVEQLPDTCALPVGFSSRSVFLVCCGDNGAVMSMGAEVCVGVSVGVDVDVGVGVGVGVGVASNQRVVAYPLSVMLEYAMNKEEFGQDAQYKYRPSLGLGVGTVKRVGMLPTKSSRGRSKLLQDVTTAGPSGAVVTVQVRTSRKHKWSAGLVEEVVPNSGVFTVCAVGREGGKTVYDSALGVLKDPGMVKISGTSAGDDYVFQGAGLAVHFAKWHTSEGEDIPELMGSIVVVDYCGRCYMMCEDSVSEFTLRPGETLVSVVTFAIVGRCFALEIILKTTRTWYIMTAPDCVRGLPLEDVGKGTTYGDFVQAAYASVAQRDMK